MFPCVTVKNFTVLALSWLLLMGGPRPLGAANRPEADRAWQVILEQASGPGNRFNNQNEALAAARAHLDKQESALREFARTYPDDSRYYSAVIRLATVLAAKARLLHKPLLMDEARRSLDDLEKDAKTPPPIKADAGYARVTQSMQDVTGETDDDSRKALLATVNQFDAAYPLDRRTGNLLAELATLYDDQPTEKKAILEEAAGKTTDPNTQRRIADDLKRIALVGQPADFRIEPMVGPAIEMASRRGRVQVILFWASYSMPALHEMARLKEIAAQLAGQPVDFLTVSVDEDRAPVSATLKAAELNWPTQCDGKGWTGELVRSLAINALPTVWVLDRKGVLTGLNARGQEIPTIRGALAGP